MKLTKIVHFRVSIEDYEMIEKAAKANELSISGFIVKSLGLIVPMENKPRKQKKIRTTPPKSIYRGVHLHKPSKTYSSKITVNGKTEYLGYFDCPIEAAKAYNQAAIKYHGEFAKLNPL